MKRSPSLPVAFALIALLFAIGSATGRAQQPASSAPAPPAIDMTPVKPESVGFSPERLDRLHAAIQEEIDQKHLAGAVTILARHGKIVDYRTYGSRDMSTATPMSKDTIFRDYSMTKPVTGVAMMILYEEGKWLPSDPISKYIPEFAHLKVFNGFDANGKMILADPDHAPTMHELMTHTAGFTYGNGDTPVDKMVPRPEAERCEEPSGEDRTAGEDPAALSARHALGLQPVDGHPGLHRREALRPIAARLHARPHLRAARHDGRRVLRSCRQARALCSRLSRGQRRACGRGDDQRRSRRLCCPAYQSRGRRRPGFDCRRLLPLRANAPEWRPAWAARAFWRRLPSS